MRNRIIKIFLSFAFVTWLGLVGLAYVVLSRTADEYSAEMARHVQQMAGTILRTQAHDLRHRLQSLLINEGVGNALLLANEVEDHEVFLQTFAEVADELQFQHIIVLNKRREAIYKSKAVPVELNQYIHKIHHHLQVSEIPSQNSILQCAAINHQLYGEYVGSVIACNRINDAWIKSLASSTGTKIHIEVSDEPHHAPANAIWHQIDDDVFIGIENQKITKWILYSLVIGTMLSIVIVVLIGRIHISWLSNSILNRLVKYTQHLQKNKEMLQKGNWTALDKMEVQGDPIDEIREMASSFNLFVDQLAAAKQEAIDAAEKTAIIEVARQVAHDIRSPLAALRAMVGQADGVPEEHRVMMRNAVQRIEDIAHDLQTRQDRGTTEDDGDSGNPSVQLLSSLIEPLISEKRTQHRAKLGVEIHAALDAESYGVFAAVRPTEFKRVVSNLINNAVEAMDRGQVTVAVRADAAQVILTVTDTGTGIPPDLLPQLMQQGATFGKAGGAGLGLFHARTAMEQWGGLLALESTVGVGTTVTMRLPRAAAPAWFVPELCVPAQTTVVIVDDDVSIHQIWQERFEAMALPAQEITLQHFSSGTDVLAWYQQQPVLLLCDYEFLGHPNNGLDLIEQLQIQDRAILVTSHYEEAPIQARCAALGVRLIPKGLAGFVPLRIGAAPTATAVAMVSTEAALSPADAPALLTALVIEDDAALRAVWLLEARRLGLAAVTTFASLEDCEAAQPEYARFDFAFVDKNIPASAYRIDQVIERLKARGVKRIFVASGESARALTSDPLCAAADGIIPMKIPQKLPQ